LTNDGVDLNLALINYGLDFLRKKSYKKVQAPFMMNKDMMSQTAQLSEFDEALYKVSYPPHHTAELTIRSLEETPRTST
jgi:seryl-tRNA synthetase